MATKKCSGCKELVVEGSIVALPNSDRIWHEKCFKCFHCSKTLVGVQHVEKDGNLYMVDCYHDLFSIKCNSCKKPISGQYVNVLGKSCHKECFKCSACGVALSNQYYNDNDQPKCQNCFAKCAKTCAGCKKPILDQQYSALDKLWHLGCFACKKCTKSFINNQYIPHEGNPYHKECYSELFLSKCQVCSKIIEGEYYQIEEHCVHDKCLDEYKKNVIHKSLSSNVNKPQPVIPEPVKVPQYIPPQKTLKEGIENAANDDYRIIAYQDLIKNPPDIDPTRKEEYLSDQEFGKYFGMTKSQFKLLPKWKQINKKKELKLFQGIE